MYPDTELMDAYDMRYEGEYDEYDDEYDDDDDDEGDDRFPPLDGEKPFWNPTYEW